MADRARLRPQPAGDHDARPGYTMRPQDWALVLLPMVHRDPAVWGEDADEFDPDRFLPERSRGRLTHTYKPFGTGERACIGRQFALHEAVLVLARILHRYDLAGDPDYELGVDGAAHADAAGLRADDRPRTPGVASSRESSDQAEPSEVCPVSSIDQPGFQATSQGCPSGSAK